MKSCYDCGKKATRELRLTDDGKLNMHVPFKPVCDDCYPWNAVLALGSSGWEGGIWREVQNECNKTAQGRELMHDYILSLDGSLANNIGICANRFGIDGNGTLCFWIADQQVAAYANGSWAIVRQAKVPVASDESLDG